MTIMGHDVRPGPFSVRGRPWVDDDSHPGVPSGGDLDNVAGLERLQRGHHLVAPVDSPRPGHRRLEVTELATHRRELHEVAQVTLGSLLVALERFLALAELAGQTHYGLVRLELCERRLEQLPRGRPAELLHQVDRHVVRRAKRRPQRVGAVSYTHLPLPTI